MKKTLRILSILLILVLLLSSISLSAFAKVVDVVEIGSPDNIPNTQINIIDDTGDAIALDGLDIDGSTIESSGVSLPSRYSSRDYGYTGNVKNQYYTGCCWAFSSTSVFETYLNRTNSSYSGIDFSSLHCAYTQSENNGKGWTFRPDWLNNGGRPEIFMGYQSSFSGSTYEYIENDNEINLEIDITREISDRYKTIASKYDAYETPVISADGFIFLNSDDPSCIKNAIMEYGAVGTSFIVGWDYFGLNQKAYYCNDSTQATDGGHSISIVGWDNNYSRNNFTGSVRPSANGAWICQNSWGTGSGDGGFFYISYEDKTIFSKSYGVTWAITSSHLPTLFEHLYNISENTIGYNDYSPFNQSKLYFSNKYTFYEDEVLQEVYFKTESEGANYEIIYYPVNNDLPNYSNPTYLASGTVPYMGYHKVTIDDFSVPAGDGYICVSLENSDGTRPGMGFCRNISGYYQYENTFAEKTAIATYDNERGGKTYSDISSRVGGVWTIRPLTTKALYYGDVNLNKVVEITDPTAIQKHLAGIAYLDNYGFLLGDVTDDNTVGISDPSIIQQYLAGMNTEFSPVGTLCKPLK